MPRKPEIWVRRDDRDVKVAICRIGRCLETNVMLVEYAYPNKARIMRTYDQFIDEWEPEPRSSWERLMES